ncbi:MAG: DNA-3-methyladenine glycosylase 2 family protein, partial [Candidatus Limnocylindrales bacterium]
DPWLTLGAIRHGRWDPTMRITETAIWRATRTPDGLATLLIERDPVGFRVRAWGPGAAHAMGSFPSLVGAGDDPSAFQPQHPLLREAVRRHPGLRFGRTDAVLEALVPSIIEQKVTGLEAWRSYRGLVRAFGERAPGPADLMVLPTPDRLAGLAYHTFHPFGLEQRRADTIRRAAASAARLESGRDLPPEAARAALRTISGVGEWTAAEVARAAWGDPDAVSVGDFHLPRLVCRVLASETRGDDARMLELLEPYRGQRARVIRLIELAGGAQQRRAPRYSPRSIAGL